MDICVNGISVIDKYNTNIVHVITLDSLQLLYLADETQACLTEPYKTVNKVVTGALLQNYNQFIKR